MLDVLNRVTSTYCNSNNNYQGQTNGITQYGSADREAKDIGNGVIDRTNNGIYNGIFRCLFRQSHSIAAAKFEETR